MGDLTEFNGNNFWHDPDVRRLSSDGKIVLVWFIKPPVERGKVSGIFHCSLDDVAHYTGVRRPIVEKIVSAKAIRNVLYDPETETAFVKNRLRYIQGGRPDRLDRSVVLDYNATRTAISLWGRFKSIYAARLSRWPFSSEALSGVASVDDELALVPPIATSGESERELDRYFSRYQERLDGEDLGLVRRVWDFLSVNLATGRVLSRSRRVDMLRRLAKYPVEVVARASFEFIRCDCIESGKRFNYFMGIVRGSATTWFAELQHERGKEAFTLDGNGKS